MQLTHADLTSHANFDLDKPIPWLLAAKNGNRLQHRTMFRAQVMSKMLSPIHTTSVVLVQTHGLPPTMRTVGVVADAIAVVVQRFLGIR